MSEALMPLYARAQIEVERGEGVWLEARDGRRFLDCVAGIATCSLGHAHPALVAALTAQAHKLWHVSNIFRIPGQEALAEKLTGATFADLVYFANSGTEAVEAALKTARRYHHAKGNPERIDVIGFAGSFHGRTYAAINASGNPTYLEGFGPRLPGFHQMTIDDMPALAEAIARPTTAAVIVEPVQGEGGARALSGEFLLELRRLTREAGVLLIHDEVQSGMGRTGKLFAHQWFPGAEPDIMAIAKALGGGFPIGACLTTAEAASGMVTGVHGTTFGGNPLAMAVGLAVFDVIAQDATLAHVAAMSDRFYTGFATLAARYPDQIVETRGKGLLMGLKLHANNREVMALAREHGLLVAGGGENCVRMLPSLLITAAEVDEALARLDATLADARARGWGNVAASQSVAA
ncbi:aspartate aminotransferase family protein [Novosphingobium pokkalii]|uniref:Acetylornithine aminotransferase n=1 Tax=Novosphingobium pokkalii TaxID=1770194 RepID=A0ABV7UZH5_9SPHN|nr:aspartate aminotransferase family protein [Novosphingobium pokkalii]GHC99178.1 acetylornithine aminotransferase [Novosphingobium pokkalii]